MPDLPSDGAASAAPAAVPPFFRPPPEPPPPWRRALELVDILRDRLVTDRRTTLAGVASVLVVVTVVLVAVRSTSSAGARPEVSLPPASGASPGRTAPVSTTPDVVVVYVAGAVAKSGVYRLPPTARVADALDAAGGAADDADLDRMNLAAPLSDGDRVYVPVQGADSADPATEPAAGGSTGDTTAPVNLNSATATELDALPGVGPSLAAAIVEFRRQHGRFGSVDGLLDVPGIGPAKLAALRERVRV